MCSAGSCSKSLEALLRVAEENAESILERDEGTERLNVDYSE